MYSYFRYDLFDQHPFPSSQLLLISFFFNVFTRTRVGCLLHVALRWKIISISQKESGGRAAIESRVLESSPGRPEYNRALKIVQAAAKKAQQEQYDE